MMTNRAPLVAWLILVAGFFTAGFLSANDDAAPRPEALHAHEQPEADLLASSPLSAETLAVREKVKQALDMYRTRHLNTRDHSPWELMHWFIAYGVETPVRIDGPAGEPITAIGWLCFNNRSRGQDLFYLQGGTLAAKSGPGVQGHAGQFLGYIAKTRLTSDYPIRVQGKDFTIADLVKCEQATCQPGTELTFKLIGLVHYLGTDATWQNEYGHWDIERLIREELAQPIRGATCGGTHRLFGLSYAVRKRMRENQPVTGEFWRAQKFTLDYHAYASSLQNPDGSMSTAFFAGRGDSPDVDRRLNTTGHVLEWMAVSLPEEELQDPRILKAFDYLSGLLIEGRQRRWPMGPLGHALHALSIYEDRLGRLDAGQAAAELADGK